MTDKNYEIRAIRNALDDYLGTQGWTGIEYREGFKSNKTIVVPMLSVRFLPSTKESLQLGGKDNENLIKRIVQIDCYMETEDRAGAVVDDAMDFFDTETVLIKDPSENTLGSVICPDSTSIYGEVIPPLLTEPQLKRWRGIVRATMESHYYAP